MTVAGKVIDIRSLENFEGSLSSRTYQSLREAIMSLELPPGTPLKKPEICSALGVSRSPVADAITRLSTEGLVVVVPQAGTYVARFEMEDILEGAFLREAVELASIEHLASRITDDQLRRLKRSLRVQKACLDDGDFVEFYNCDRAFHISLIEFTGHRKVIQVASTAWVNVDRLRKLMLPLPGRVAGTYDEHMAVYDALEARDPAAAREALKAHLGMLIHAFAPLEKNYPEFFERRH